MTMHARVICNNTKYLYQVDERAVVSMKGNVSLSVIIVTYFGQLYLKECLDSIIKYNDIGEQLEVIISDNSYTNEVVDFINSNYSWVKVVHNDKNLGFGYGNNRGVEHCRGEIVLFLNPDTILVEPIFQFVLDVFNKKSDISMLGLKLINRDGSYNHPHALMDSFGIWHVIKQNYYWKHDVFISSKMFITGADIFIRKDIFLKCGAFDENIFMYYEESDLIRRLKKVSPSTKIAYFPEKKIIHLEGGMSKTSLEKTLNAEKRAMESLKYYSSKYGLCYVTIINKLIRLQIIRIVKQKLKRNFDGLKLEEKKLQLYKKIKEVEI